MAHMSKAYISGFHDGRLAAANELADLEKCLELERKRVYHALLRLGWTEAKFSLKAPDGWVCFDCDKVAE